MATYEYNGLMTVKDAAGNKYLLYPITKAECVDGLEEALAAKAASSPSTNVKMMLTRINIQYSLRRARPRKPT